MAKPLTTVPKEAQDLDAFVLGRKQQEPRVSIWEPPAAVNTNRPPAAIPIEQALIGVIVEPLTPGESHRTGNDRKERELAALFEQLMPAQSPGITLVSRLLSASVLSVAFGQLVVERRARLLATLSRHRAIAATIAQRPSRS